MKKKIALLLACVMAFGIAVGGTLAWLIDDTDPVVNTFAPSTINIDLTETFTKDTDGDGKADVWEKKMVPGDTLAKDPKVTVGANSEACWLFVKVEKSANFDTYMTYGIADGWKAVSGFDGVYYREVAASTAAQEFVVLKENKVTVKETVTKAQMDDLTTDYPTLTFTAYAIQSANLKDGATAVTTAEAAWKLTPGYVAPAA